MPTSSENIAAAAALSKIAEIKQFGLEENYSHLVEMELVRSMNSQAKEVTGIDLLNLSKPLSLEDYDKYETFLDEIIDSNLSKRFATAFIVEEIRLLEKAEEYPTSTLKEFSYNEDAISVATKRIFKKIGMSIPSIIPILKTPLRVQKINNDLPEFLSVSKFNLKSKNIYVLFHISLGAYNNSDKIQSISKIAKDENITVMKGNSNHASVATCFLFNEATAHDKNPIELFLKALIKYGQTVTIGATTNKFFNKGTNSTLLINNADDIKLLQQELGVQGAISGHFRLTKTKTGYDYSNLYFLYAERMEQDYASHHFQ